MTAEKLFLQTHITALISLNPNFLLEGNQLILLYVEFPHIFFIGHLIALLKTTGSGGFINLYDFHDHQLLDSVDLFRGSRIHGIHPAPNNNRTAAVFGGKRLALIEIEQDNTHLQCSKHRYNRKFVKMELMKAYLHNKVISNFPQVDSEEIMGRKRLDPRCEDC